MAKRIETYHWDVADKPVAAKFAAELRSLAQQPAAVDGAMDRTKWRCAFCGGAYYLPSPSGRFCCEAQAKFRAAQQQEPTT